VYLVVAYDVVDDRRRGRLAGRLLDFLPRVQKSVYEGELPERRLEELERAVLEWVDLDVDSVRIYRLCRGCCTAVTAYGIGVAPGRPTRDEVVV
jgi:CRISPR-associated protein Cas2